MKIFNLLTGVLIGGTVVMTANDIFSYVENKVDEKNNITINGERQAQEEIKKRNSVIESLIAQFDMITNANMSPSPEELLSSYGEEADKVLNTITPMENITPIAYNSNQSTVFLVKRMIDEFTSQELDTYKELAKRYANEDIITTVLYSYTDNTNDVKKEALILSNNTHTWNGKGTDWYEGDVHYKVYLNNQTGVTDEFFGNMAKIYTENDYFYENQIIDFSLIN